MEDDCSNNCLKKKDIDIIKLHVSAVSHCYRREDKYLQNVVKVVFFVRH